MSLSPPKPGWNPVAIQTAFHVALTFGVTELPFGLPRRFAPRNDEWVELARCFVLRHDRQNPTYESITYMAWLDVTHRVDLFTKFN
jgi:hypothetical protein